MTEQELPVEERPTAPDSVKVPSAGELPTDTGPDPEPEEEGEE